MSLYRDGKISFLLSTQSKPIHWRLDVFTRTPAGRHVTTDKQDLICLDIDPLKNFTKKRGAFTEIYVVLERALKINRPVSYTHLTLPTILLV